MLKLRTVLVALGVGAVALGPALAAPPTGASAAQPGIPMIGRLNLTSACYQQTATGVDRTLGAVIVLQLAVTGTAGCSAADGLVFRTFSTSTLKVLSDRVPTLSANLYRLDARQLTVDEVHHRVFAYFISQTPGFPNDIVSFSTADLVQGHGPIAPMADIQVPSNPAQASTSSPTNLVPSRNPTGPAGDDSIVPTGMAYDPIGDDLYLILAQQSRSYFGATSTRGPAAADDVYLARVSVHDGAVAWLLALDQCTYSPKITGEPFKADDPIALVRQAGQTAILTGCLFNRAPAVFDQDQFAAISMLSYVIPLDSSLNPVSSGITYSIGRSGVLGGLADPASGRLFWPASPPYQQAENSGSGPAAVVFDGQHRVYLGAPTVGGPPDITGGFMMAVGGGRYYSLGRGGVIVGDATATPPGQGVVVLGFSCSVGSAAVDSRTRRLFAQEVTNCADSNSTPKPYFDVFQDELPNLSPASPANPDSYTAQLNEAPGVTASQFNGHAEAIGSRIRLVGGTRGFVNGASFNGYQYVFGPNALGPVAPPLPVDDNSRDLSFGVVHGSNLDNYQASSNAIASSADDASANQIASNQVAPTWPFKEVHCSDPGSKQAGGADSSDTGATVNCDDGGRTTSAASSAGPYGLSLKLTGQTTTLSLPMSVAQSVTNTHVWMDPSAGIISESQAISRGIDLGVVTINQVESDMRCQAHGRTGTARCTYSRLVSGVASGGAPIGGGACVETDGPTGTVGSCSTLLGALNAIEPGQIIFGTPAPDGSANTFRGSPGGYQSVGKREFYEHLQDDVLNYDSSNQVPGLEITYVNDSSFQPSRLNLQLSGTEAETHYGIQPAASNDFVSTDTGPTTDTIAPLPPVGQLAPVAAPANAGPTLWHLITRALQRVFDGIAVLLRSPVTGLVVAALLLMMASPLGIAWRRRCLLIALSGG